MVERFNKKMKRFLCGSIAVVMLAGYLPGQSVFAGNETETVPVISITEEETPLTRPGTGPSITIQNPGEGEVTDFGEEETPLAGPAGHRCCVLHFMLLLAAFVMEVLYISRVKKGQKEIFAARTRLDAYNANGRL